MGWRVHWAVNYTGTEDFKHVLLFVDIKTMETFIKI